MLVHSLAYPASIASAPAAAIVSSCVADCEEPLAPCAVARGITGSETTNAPTLASLNGGTPSSAADRSSVIAVDGLAFIAVAHALDHAKVLADRVRARGNQLLKSRLRLGRFLLDLRPHVGYGHWDETLRAVGIPLHTARRAMRLARELQRRHALLVSSEIEPIGSVSISDLDSRSLHSLESELGVRHEPPVIILERIEPEIGCVSSVRTPSPRPAQPEPITLIKHGLPKFGPQVGDPPAPPPPVQGEAQGRCLAGPGLVIRDGPPVRDEPPAQVSGQRLLSEVYEVVERVNRAFGMVAGLDPTKVAEVRDLLTTLAIKLDEIARGEG